MRGRRGAVWMMALAVGAAAFGGQEKPYWLDAMKAAHQGFAGNAGQVAQLGDSITYSMAFWSPLGWADPTPWIPDDGLPKQPKTGRWRDVIKGCRDKGPEKGNYSGWRVGNLLGVIDQVLTRDKPEAAILMIGTNDISGSRVPADYQAGLETIVRKCLAAKCIPILNTIPPKRGHAEAVAEANKLIKEVAQKHKVPMVDYCAEILRLQPGNAWDGTLISGDGVHPTAGRTQDYDAENLKVSGYALRNWLNFLAVRELYFGVFAK